MGIEGPDPVADTTSMKSHRDNASALILLPLIVIAIGVGIFAAYAVTAVGSIVG